MENYKEKCEQYLERAKKEIKECGDNQGRINMIKRIFPELKESEDERLRKATIEFVRQNNSFNCTLGISKEQVIAWLEKQGEQKSVIIIPKFRAGDEIKTSNEESLTITKIDDKGYWSGDLFICDFDEECLWDLVEQKPTDKVEPKFKVGDWVQIEGGHVMNILEVKKDVLCYKILNWCGNESVRKISDIDSIAHLWTIQDAKDGDVLYHKSPLTGIEFIVMSRGVNDYGSVDSYFRYNSEDGFDTNVPSVFSAKLDDITPATKEQRDILFQKMKEAGYEWDAEKKEIRKTCQKPNYCHHEVDETGWTEEYRKAYYDGWNNCNQQHAQLEAQRKPTWSEEDEEIINRICTYLDTYKSRNSKDSYGIEECKYLKNRLKSLKPYWKPSEEQMEALKYCIDSLGERTTNFSEYYDIESLYNDLKKL